jgi:hypothetical protein
VTFELGFPPADEHVRDWLLQSKTKSEAFTRASAFLCALFVVLLEYLKNIDNELAGTEFYANEKQPGSIEAKFRLLMTTGQTFLKQGLPRRQFYKKVLDLADQVCSSHRPHNDIVHIHITLYKLWLPLPPSTPSQKAIPHSPGLLFNVLRGPKDQNVTYDLEMVLKKLMEFLIRDFDVLRDYDPAVILSFDETHSLTVIEEDMDGHWSKFSELRRAIQIAHLYPCFSVFLSTISKFQQYTPGLSSNASSRIQEGKLHLLSPFCELGFDQLAEKARSGETTLEDVSSLKFMARLGRPL